MEEEKIQEEEVNETICGIGAIDEKCQIVEGNNISVVIQWTPGTTAARAVIVEHNFIKDFVKLAEEKKDQIPSEIKSILVKRI